MGDLDELDAAIRNGEGQYGTARYWIDDRYTDSLTRATMRLVWLRRHKNAARMRAGEPPTPSLWSSGLAGAEDLTPWTAQ